jgi:hypothetical protein
MQLDTIVGPGEEGEQGKRYEERSNMLHLSVV